MARKANIFTVVKNVEIYIGSPVEQITERDAIAKVIHELDAKNRPGIVIANSSFSGKQIDLIVVTETEIVLIEVKGHRQPLRGSVDGSWKLKTSSGGWKPVANFYQQTLKAMHALKDSMYEYNKKMISYPVAALVFVPDIPQGSSVPPSDEKVKVGGIDLIEALFSSSNKVCWGLDIWHTFLQEYNLTRVNSINEAFNEKLAICSANLIEYEKNFLREYCSDIGSLIPVGHNIDGVSSGSLDIHELAKNYSMHIVGPSGCGKSLIIKSLAAEYIRCGIVPIIIEAKYFDSNFQDLIDDEISLLGIESFSCLYDMCASLNRRIVFIIDGLNECSSSKQSRLIRYITEATSKHQADIVITSQAREGDLRELPLSVVEIFRPTLDEKMAIAFGNSQKAVPSGVLELLIATDSCLEASIVGNLEIPNIHEMNRFSIFDIYIRNLLGEQSQEGIRLLSELALYFSKHIVFSVSTMEYDRILAEEPTSAALLNVLISKNLIKKLGDRFSFGHELFFNAFVVEGLIRQSGEDADQIISALSLPKHCNHKKLIIGSIRNLSLFFEVLNKLSDEEVIWSCVRGECGEQAQRWALKRSKEVLRKIEAELTSVRFKIDQNGWMNIGVEDSSLHKWSSQELAFIDVIPSLILKGYFVDIFFELASILDSRLQYNWDQLIDEAKSLNIKNLRSSLFGEAFVNQNSKISFSRIVSKMGIHLFFSGDSDFSDLVKWLEDQDFSREYSNGQFYSILRLASRAGKTVLLTGVVAQVIRQRWKHIPYHLMLELLDSAQMCGDAPDEQRNDLIDALRGIETSNIFVSSMLLDALKCLDEIDDIGQAQLVQNEIAEVLANYEDPDSWRIAQSIYNYQFDHIFDHVYWESIENLPSEEKKKFLVMAVRGKSDFKMFLTSLIWRLVDLEDPSIAQYIEHWTEYPSELGSMPQDSVQVFLVSHVALAKLKYPLPEKIYSGSPFENTMNAIGELYYWLNRKDLGQDLQKASCEIPLKVLKVFKSNESIKALYLSSRSLKLSSKYFRENGYDGFVESAFPEDMAEIGRSVLQERKDIKGDNFLYEKNSIISYACYLVGESGLPEDVIILKELVDDPSIGSEALKAIKALQERS